MEIDWKRIAVGKLRGYEAHRRALENIPEEIRRLESAMSGIRSAETDSTPVQGGSCTREDRMLSNIVHRQELERTLEQAKAWVKTVDNGLGALDEEERLVLDRLYIHRAKGNVDRLCEELDLKDERSVYKRKDKAIRHFTIALYGMVEF